MKKKKGNLCLCLRPGMIVKIGDDIEIEIDHRNKSRQARIVVRAPEHIGIHRIEVNPYDEAFKDDEPTSDSD